jgi:hypothetical protein
MSDAPQMRSPAPPASGNRANRSSFARHRTTTNPNGRAIDFRRINAAALAHLGPVLCRLLPGGNVIGGEYIARNPCRRDNRPGSFKVRFHGPRTGAWADFATGDKGGDVVSLAAYVDGVSQAEAARRLARMLGLDSGGRRNG